MHLCFWWRGLANSNMIGSLREIVCPRWVHSDRNFGKDRTSMCSMKVSSLTSKQRWLICWFFDVENLKTKKASMSFSRVLAQWLQRGHFTALERIKVSCSKRNPLLWKRSFLILPNSRPDPRTASFMQTSQNGKAGNWQGLRRKAADRRWSWTKRSQGFVRSPHVTSTGATERGTSPPQIDVPFAHFFPRTKTTAVAAAAEKMEEKWRGGNASH